MATLVFSTTACLDKYPDDMVPADKAITTVDEVDQAIIGIYASWLNGALYSGYLTLLPDIQADLAYAVNGYSNQFGNTGAGIFWLRNPNMNRYMPDSTTLLPAVTLCWTT